MAGELSGRWRVTYRAETNGPGAYDPRQRVIQGVYVLGEPVDEPPYGVGVEELHGKVEDVAQKIGMQPEAGIEAPQRERECAHQNENCCTEE